MLPSSIASIRDETKCLQNDLRANNILQLLETLRDLKTGVTSKPMMGWCHGKDFIIELSVVAVVSMPL